MKNPKVVNYVKSVLENMPQDWLRLTTHRLDIYDESQAKTQFLAQLEDLFQNDNAELESLENLPTAFDYIRLGHPLSCLLEWAIAKSNNLDPDEVISFSSQTIPIMAILRKNGLENKRTQIVYTDELPDSFNVETLKRIYGYQFELKKVESADDVSTFDGSSVFVSEQQSLNSFYFNSNIDFVINTHPRLGSIIAVNGGQNRSYISEIQHVRRRETIAMTPANCLNALKMMPGSEASGNNINDANDNRTLVLDTLKTITGTDARALVGSSGLSIQYAIMMGLTHDALENHHGKAIKFVVPPNCYGGTNDQARRVAASIDNVEVVDLPVDGGNDMVQSIDTVLDLIAKEDAIPYIIAEIPTNPRVEVPDLVKLKQVLSAKRTTPSGTPAIAPVFILDQTFCPNVQFLGANDMLSEVQTISYVSGSKFPSGGLCTAGYSVANAKAEALMDKIEQHLRLCDNEATPLQMEILSKQLPSMIQRIDVAYQNTREFVNFIENNLPEAKINFVSDALANQGFTPSVFSLDLPTEGDTEEAREAYKRESNLRLINLMIKENPYESKFCVSYGQLKGCYWTIPATSTQGTTKESDKDYIVRASLSPKLDMELHKKVFLDFVKST